MQNLISKTIIYSFIHRKDNSYKTSSGEYKNDPCYITTIVWGKQAEACNIHLIKGSGVMVEGRLKYRTWKNNEEKTQSVIEIRAINVQFMPKNVKERFSGTFKTERGYQAKVGGRNLALDSSATLRVQSWQGVIKDLKYHPILGYGITGYWFIDAQYFRTLIELGLLGLCIYIYLMYSIFKFILETHRIASDSLGKGLTMGVLAGFVSLLLHAIGSNTFIIVRIMEPFWFLMGLLVVLYNIEKDEHKELKSESIKIQEKAAYKLLEPKKVS